MIGLRPFVALVVALVTVFTAPARAMDIQVVPVAGIGEVWLVENHSLPIIAASVAFRGAGAAQDAAEQSGLATLTAGLLNEGAGDLDSAAFQARLEGLSIELGFEAGRDHMVGRLKTLTENRAEAFRLLGLAVTAPRFDAEAVERVRNQLLAMIAAGEQRPATVASRTWYARAYPNHPYGRAIEGTAATVTALAAADIRTFAATRFARDNLILTVVGDITAAEVAQVVGAAFAALPVAPQLTPVAEVTASAPPGVLVVARPIPQSTVVFGSQGIKRDDPEWFPSFVMNYVLGGGGFASRLMNEVRERRGLAYGVSTALVPFEKGGLFVGSVGTQNERAKDSMTIISAEIGKLRDGGVTAAELDGAKKYLTGSYPLSFDTSPRIAGQLAAIRLDGFGPDYVTKRNAELEAVTLEEVNQAARRLLDSAALSWVVVGEPVGVVTTAP